MWLPEHERRRAFTALSALRDDHGAGAASELVGYFESEDEAVSLEAARILADRDVPDELRERVAAGLLAGAWPRRHTWGAGARALVGHPRAVELAEPLLRVDVVTDEFTRAAAQAVFGAVEDQLARASRQQAALPDARFRTLALEAARLDPELASYADLIDSAFRYFEDGSAAVSKRAEFLPDEYLPVIVAGVRLAYGPLPPFDARGCPPGLVAYEHQYGGYACNQQDTFGYMLQVPSSDAIHDVLDAVNRAHDGLHGEAMDAAGLAHWNEPLRPWCGGALVQISEGLVLAEARTHALFGLEILQFGTAYAPWRTWIDVERDRDIVLAGPFGEAHERALVELGRTHGLAPCTAILMENSD